MAYKRDRKWPSVEAVERAFMNLDDWRDVTLIDEPMDESDPSKLVEERIKTLKAEFEHCMALCNDQGWFLEFGVYEGRTINLCSSLRPDSTFYGFDSFEGLPEKWVMSQTKTIDEKYFALDHLPKVNNNVNLIPGFFDQSLPSWIKDNLDSNSTISWLHIDCDLYSSAKSVLNLLNDYIVEGTVIRFDELVDWRYEGFKTIYPHTKPKPKYPNWRDGEWKAVNEWMLNYDRQIQPSWREWHMGGGVVVVK